MGFASNLIHHPLSLPVFSVYTILWCFLHSYLLSVQFVSVWRRVAGKYSGWHRLVYNCIAAVTILPMAVYIHTVEEPVLFSWSGIFIVFRILILLCALGLFYFGSKAYDTKIFLGIPQVKGGEASVLLSADGTFSREGVHGVIRHPWYAGSILFLWTVWSSYSLSAVVIFSILTSYLVVGAFIEECRLERIYGEEYREYCREVSMFLPWKWIQYRLNTTEK